MAVPDLGKANYIQCEHVCEKGCGIYAERPESCATFECLWLQGMIDGDERRRPDNLGIMFAEAKTQQVPVRMKGKRNRIVPVLIGWEVWPGARTDTKAAHFLGRMAKEAIVIIRDTEGNFRGDGPGQVNVESVTPKGGGE
jgi:hypothetical protein